MSADFKLSVNALVSMDSFKSLCNISAVTTDLTSNILGGILTFVDYLLGLMSFQNLFCLSTFLLIMTSNTFR